MTEVEYSIVVDELTDIISRLPNVEMPILPQPKTDLDYLIQIDKVKHMIRFFEALKPTYKPKVVSNVATNLSYGISGDLSYGSYGDYNLDEVVPEIVSHIDYLHREEPATKKKYFTKERVVKFIYGFGMGLVIGGIFWWPLFIIGGNCIWAGYIIDRYYV
jgi:hypothetical protein